jgi:hypothetical protein
LISRVAGSTRWGREPDRTAATAAAREAFLDRFEREARDLFPDLPPEEIAWRAERLRKAHFTRLALKSAQARRKAKGAEQ